MRAATVSFILFVKREGGVIDGCFESLRRDSRSTQYPFIYPLQNRELQSWVVTPPFPSGPEMPQWKMRATAEGVMG